MASDERERMAGVRYLAPYLDADSIWKAQGLMKPENDYEKMIDDPEKARVFTRLYNFYKDSKNEFADLIDMTGVEKMMDAGGGSGAVSILLAQKYPALGSVVVEFDMVLHYDVGVFGEELFRRLWESLNLGGRIVVVFHSSPGENTAPTRYLGWAFRDSLYDPDFGFPTISQFQAQLLQAGFRLLPAMHTLSQGQTVLQAQKI